MAYAVRRLCSDFMDMLWCLISCRIIIIIITQVDNEQTRQSRSGWPHIHALLFFERNLPDGARSTLDEVGKGGTEVRRLRLVAATWW